MLRFEHITDSDAPPYSTLTLSFEQRSRSRLKVELDNGEPAGLFLPRGSVLLHGQLLAASSGEIVEVRAAEETVSTAYADDPLLLARACYHLGNRHVALQIGAGFARYRHDHVLDELLAGMGLRVVVEQAPFEPEAGAYGAHAHDPHEH